MREQDEDWFVTEMEQRRTRQDLGGHVARRDSRRGAGATMAMALDCAALPGVLLSAEVAKWVLREAEWP